MADYSIFLKELHDCKILGINPPVMDFAFFDLWAKPLGLLYILDSLRREGNDVHLIDCISEAGGKPKSFGKTAPAKKPAPKPDVYKSIPRRFYHFGIEKETFRHRLIESGEPDLVLVTSMMTYWYPGVYWAISLIREVFPKVPVMLGGIYARLCPEHAALSGADMIQTVPLNLEFSLPAVDLYSRLPYAVTMTSFGCPFNCGYCASSILQPSYKMRQIEEVIAEIDYQTRCGHVRDVAFYDDALLFGKFSHFYPLCEKLIENFPGIRFHTPNGLHVRMIDACCAHLLRRTGFSTIRLSFEGTDRTLKKAQGEKTDLDSLAGAVENLRIAGFSDDEIETYVLIGLPGQSFEEMEANIRTVKDLGVRVKIAQFSPIPGTEVFEEITRALSEIRKEPLLHNNTIFSSYVLKILEPSELQSLKDLARST